MPTSPVAWILLVLAVTPGWCAIRGWCRARSTAPPDALGDWLPPVTVLGLTWTGLLVLLCGSTTVSLAAGASPGLRVSLWIGGAFALWMIPWLVAWTAGRLWPGGEPPASDFVTVVMKNGSTVDGTYLRLSASRLILARAATGELRGQEIEIALAEIQLIVRTPHHALSTLNPKSDGSAPWDWPRPAPAAVLIGSAGRRDRSPASVREREGWAARHRLLGEE